MKKALFIACLWTTFIYPHSASQLRFEEAIRAGDLLRVQEAIEAGIEITPQSLELALTCAQQASARSVVQKVGALSGGIGVAGIITWAGSAIVKAWKDLGVIKEQLFPWLNEVVSRKAGKNTPESRANLKFQLIDALLKGDDSTGRPSLPLDLVKGLITCKKKITEPELNEESICMFCHATQKEAVEEDKHTVKVTDCCKQFLCAECFLGMLAFGRNTCPQRCDEIFTVRDPKIRTYYEEKKGLVNLEKDIRSLRVTEVDPHRMYRFKKWFTKLAKLGYFRRPYQEMAGTIHLDDASGLARFQGAMVGYPYWSADSDERKRDEALLCTNNEIAQKYFPQYSLRDNGRNLSDYFAALNHIIHPQDKTKINRGPLFMEMIKWPAAAILGAAGLGYVAYGAYKKGQSEYASRLLIAALLLQNASDEVLFTLDEKYQGLIKIAHQ